MEVYMQSSNKRFDRIIMIVLFIIISLVLLFFIVFSSNKKSKDGAVGEYYDPGSGETVSDPKDRAPEKVGQTSPEITYLGISKLLDAGVTEFQLDSFRLALNMFSGTNNYFIKEASVTVSSITSEQIQEGDFYRVIKFELVVNRNTNYNAELYLESLSNVKLKLIENDKLVFDSPMFDSKEEEFTGDGENPVPPVNQGE